MQFIEILFAVVLLKHAEGKYSNQQLFKHNCIKLSIILNNCRNHFWNPDPGPDPPSLLPAAVPAKPAGQPHRAQGGGSEDWGQCPQIQGQY